jgi:hypothetical protein
MRDAINRDEYAALVAAVKSGKTWDETRGVLPGVDPIALDKNFKAIVLKAAGVEDVQPATATEEVEEVMEPEAKHPKAKHPVVHHKPKR